MKTFFDVDHQIKILSSSFPHSKQSGENKSSGHEIWQFFTHFNGFRPIPAIFLAHKLRNPQTNACRMTVPGCKEGKINVACDADEKQTD
jgi:hypothetical protein